MVDRQAIESIAQKLISDKTDVNQSQALAFLLEELLNQIAYSERKIFLQKQARGKDKGNGHYDRTLATSIGNLDISVPRVRSGNFRPSILPPLYQRTHYSYKELLNTLMINGYSDTNFYHFFKALNLPYSRTEVKKIKQDLLTRLDDFKTQEIPSEVFAIFIDAYHCRMKIKNRVKKVCLFVIAAIDLEANKIPIGFYLMEGAETKEKWLQVLNDLVNRGLKKMMLVVSDDFPGLDAAIKSLFPKAEHQLCYIHLQRNVRRNMSKQDAKVFVSSLTKLRMGDYDFETACSLFLELCERYEKKYPAFIAYLKKKAENYMAFFKYPESIRKFFYTTNISENINKQIERMRINLGGYFQSREVLEINVYLQFIRLENGRWRKGVSELKAKLYELSQMFAQRYAVS